MLQVVLPYAVFGLEVHDGKVFDAPPIARWTVGKDAEYVAAYYRGKGAVISVITGIGEPP